MSLAFLVSLLVASNSFIATWAIQHFLAPYVSKVNIGQLELSFWNGTLKIKDFSASDELGKNIQFKNFIIKWNNRELFNNKLILQSSQIQGLKLDIDSANLVPTQVGPFVLAQFNQPKKPAASKNDWSITINDIQLSDWKICLFESIKDFQDLKIPLKHNQKLNACVLFNQFAIKDKINISNQQKITYNGSINLKNLTAETLDQLPLLSLKSLNFTDVSFDENIQVNKLSLQKLEVLEKTKPIQYC